MRSFPFRHVLWVGAFVCTAADGRGGDVPTAALSNKTVPDDKPVRATYRLAYEKGLGVAGFLREIKDYTGGVLKVSSRAEVPPRDGDGDALPLVDVVVVAPRDLQDAISQIIGLSLFSSPMSTRGLLAQAALPAGAQVAPPKPPAPTIETYKLTPKVARAVSKFLSNHAYVPIRTKVKLGSLEVRATPDVHKKLSRFFDQLDLK